MLKRLIYYLLIISTLLSIGFYRDYLFKKINALLQAWDHDMDYTMPSALRFFESLEYDTIVNTKWLFTFFFCLLYLIVSLFTIQFLFHKKKYLLITIVAYGAIVLLSAVFILIGLLSESSSEKMYEFARYFMGMAQSPIVLMILIPVFKLSEKEKNKTIQ